MGNLLTFIKSIVIIAIGTFSWGFITYKFYTWFLLEVFNLPEITLVQAIGIKIFISLFETSSMNFAYLKQDVFEESRDIRMITGFIVPWVILLTGYIFKILFL